MSEDNVFSNFTDEGQSPEETELRKEAQLIYKLQEAGVDVQDGIYRFSGNKEAYMKYLREFFVDEDLENCKRAMLQDRIEDAFEYAHGMKGLAGTLSIRTVYEKLVVLVEILRKNSLDGALQAYDEASKECDMIRDILEEV